MKVNITYESLFDALRKERSTEELQELPESFYDDTNNYLSQKVQDATDSKSQAQIINIKKIIKELFERRQKKLLIMAFNQGRTEKELVRPRLLNEEKYFYDNNLELIKKHNSLLKRIITPGEVNNAPETENIESSGSEVEFLTDIPKFLGKDLESYGPFKKGDRSVLPEDLARILIDKKRARRNV